jgi:hypothetical protein
MRCLVLEGGADADEGQVRGEPLGVAFLQQFSPLDVGAGMSQGARSAGAIPAPGRGSPAGAAQLSGVGF